MAIDEITVLLPIDDLTFGDVKIDEAGGGPALTVSECRACGRPYWPARPRCLVCGGTDFAAATVPGRGTLYSFSMVHVSSTRPTPYTIGYVDLTPGLRVLADIAGDPASLGCDQPVTLVTGAERLTFAARGEAA